MMRPVWLVLAATLLVILAHSGVAKENRVLCGQNFFTVIWIADSGATQVTIRKKDVIRVATAPRQHVAGVVVKWTEPEGIMPIWIVLEDFKDVVACLD